VEVQEAAEEEINPYREKSCTVFNDEDKKFLEKLARKLVIWYVCFWGGAIVLLHVGIIIRRVFDL